MPYRCLILERDDSAAESISREFPVFGFKPTLASNCDSALGILRQWCFDAIVLDADGFGRGYLQVLKRLQSGSQRSPLVLLARAADEGEQILGLESGATDIVVKPASARLITTKLRRLIEVATRDAEEAPVSLRLGPLAMHADHAYASIGDVPLKLTAHEFALLYLLASHAGRFVDRETIAAALRGTAGAVGRGADVHVYRIRKKLRERGVGGLCLDTIYGRGYCLSLRDTPDCFDIVSTS
jgi:DNA-binding response OmpR family regulator